MNIQKHIRAIVLLPVTVTIFIPAGLVYFTDSLNIAWSLPGLSTPALIILGCACVAGGLCLVIPTVTLFAKEGQGTLAPWDPTQKLVVLGAYRYVRNPMMSGVFCILIGETFLLGSVPVLCWSLFFILANCMYIPLSEEPGLVRRFGTDYLLYKNHVPRWIPRRTPWDLPGHGE